MSRKLDNVRRLYLEGIRDGHARRAVEACTGDRYTQHSTGVADGVEGFVAFFEPFLARNPIREIEIVRAIEDGPHVFVHAHQRLNGGESEWVTADLFDTDADDLIVEHWDTITPFVPGPAGGPGPIDGQVEVTDLERTSANKAVVAAFVETVLAGGRRRRRGEFVSAPTYVEHGRATPAGDAPARYEEIRHLVGQGNFVVTYSRVAGGGGPYAAFDIFRLDGGLIVEHWDNWEKVAPPGEWNNSGKF